MARHTRESLKKGGIIIQVIAFASISVLILSGFVQWANMTVKLARKTEIKEQAIQIAEAGIEYYRWHLAHDSTDYQDGTGAPGPYVHDYFDKQGVKIGTYSLGITPPPLGSTVVTITATGTTLADPSAARAIRVRLGKPSVAKFAVLSNSLIQFGGGTELFGPVHANGGVAFYGDRSHNLVTSALAQYLDPGTAENEWAVHQDGPDDPDPPGTLATVTAKFLAGRDINIPATSFTDFIVDMGQMQAKAIASGNRYAASGDDGYHVVLNTNDTYDVFVVNTLRAMPANCRAEFRYVTPSDTSCVVMTPQQSTWSINTQTQIVNDKALPADGIIFLEDHTWVDGSIDSARVTIAVGDFGAADKNIIVNNNLTYTSTTTGENVIGLIAENNFMMGLYSQDFQRVDAAIIAQNGRLFRPIYRNNGGTCANDTLKNPEYIEFFGMFASFERYYLRTGCTETTGYKQRDFWYDPNLLYSPPPSFPLTTDNYQIISWEEL